MNIVNLFLNAAKKYPNHTAIIELDKKISYEELNKQVIQTAAYFKSKGLKKGDRVLVFAPMSINLYRIVLALFYIGATAVFLDEWVSMKRLELCCEIARCRGFIGGFKATAFSWFSAPLRRIPIKLNLTKMEQGLPTMEKVEAETPALITFTTGSTGTPKAALRSHGFLNEQFNALLDEIDPSETDIDMPVLPIVLFVNLGVGCTSVIANFKMTKPNSLNPSKIASQLQKNGVTRITASPFFIKKVAEYSKENKLNFPKLDKVFTGGAPVFPTEAKLYCDAFPKTESKIVYGSTEAEPISSISAKELATNKQLDKGLPVGIPYHKAQVKIIAIEEGAIVVSSESELDQLELEEGEIGEIIVEGPHVLKQYFNNEEAFRQNKIIVDDKIWHRTGDSGYTQNEELFLTGRCKQLIHSNNEIISPFIIENQVQAIEGIEVGTVIKIKNDVVLVVQSKLAKEKVKELVHGIRHNRISILAKIPMDPRHNSKIDYEKLKTVLK
ncbi:MAG: AMP-dependent synthetase [Crocinitomicaceae bacterium]|nr:AMP-dependent synthetase [Crocinitomicaceae bacterium]|tara:strand:+ start:12853 stop:14346 length:1494 start_codon:yes stop_codon:yes gene_type:complete